MWTLLSLFLGCSAWWQRPAIVRLEVTEGSCRQWAAELEVVDLRGQTVRLRQGDRVVGTWTDVWGDQTIRAQGAALDGAGFDLVAEIAGTTEQHFAPLLLLDRPVSLTPVDPEGLSPRFQLEIDPACPAAGLRYRASTGTWSDERPVAPGGPAQLVLPPHPPGTHVLLVELRSDEGLLGSDSAVFVAAGGGDALEVDLDHDGYQPGLDCDDADPAVHPFAPEHPQPNGRDDNCDGRIDEGTVVYDDDGDGLAERGGDCDDRDPLVHPGAAERGNCRDDDCDEQIDEGRPVTPRDDTYERPGDEPFTFTEVGRRFQTELRLVSRDEDDQEVVRFWSDDGPFDEWGIDVIAAGVPADSVYEVEIRRADGVRVGGGTLRASGDLVTARGSSVREDSGLYDVFVRPARLYAPYCPVELSIVSR